jgi:hypothetical protein
MAEKVQRKVPKSPRKRQWQRPRVKSGKLFESNSLACNKTGIEAACQETFAVQS